MSPDEIRDVRTRLGWSQSELAEALSVDGRVHPMTVSKWERGETTPQPYLRLALERLAAKRRRKR
ncbi:MAG: helix-turn-helix domain-containing protein [Longimicrobiales bacterium]